MRQTQEISLLIDEALSRLDRIEDTSNSSLDINNFPLETTEKSGRADFELFRSSLEDSGKIAPGSAQRFFQKESE